jgi:ubiquinone/menaquinone biosynthesis C-methylase UbiE
MGKSIPSDYSLLSRVYDQFFTAPLGEGHSRIGEIVSQTSFGDSGKMLEVGVGSGLTLQFLPKGVAYTGIDINELMLSFAKDKKEDMPDKDITLKVMDAHELDFENDTFDLVTAPSVITALRDPLQGTRELIRVTKPGGKIIIIANLRKPGDPISGALKLLDPITRKFLGYRMDLNIGFFEQFENAEMIARNRINYYLGMPLSYLIILEKK